MHDYVNDFDTIKMLHFALEQGKLVRVEIASHSKYIFFVSITIKEFASKLYQFQFHQQFPFLHIIYC